MYARLLDIIPEDYWALAGYLEIYIEDLVRDDEENRRRAKLERFVELQRKLKDLKIHDFDVENGAEVEILKNLFTLLFESCKESLTELHILDCNLQTVPLSDVPLKNLSYLRLTITEEPGFAWYSLMLVDASTLMPKLEEVSIEVKFRHLGTRRRWPPLYLGTRPARRPYGRVRQLEIDFENANVDLYAVSAMFPNVSSLTMYFYRSRCIHFGEIWEFWPNLEVLNIRGDQMTLEQNFDSEFCGRGDRVEGNG